MDKVKRKFSRIVAAYGYSFPIAALITYIILDLRNGKPLRIVYLPLPMAVSGFCVGLSDCDLITIRSGLNEEQRLMTLLHELSHFILKHVKLHSDKYGLMKLQEFLSSVNLNLISTDDFLRHDAITGYSSQIELDAELLATLLAPCIYNIGTIPDNVRDLYRIRGG